MHENVRFHEHRVYKTSVDRNQSDGCKESYKKAGHTDIHNGDNPEWEFIFIAS